MKDKANNCGISDNPKYIVNVRKLVSFQPPFSDTHIEANTNNPLRCFRIYWYVSVRRCSTFRYYPVQNLCKQKRETKTTVAACAKSNLLYPHFCFHKILYNQLQGTIIYRVHNILHKQNLPNLFIFLFVHHPSQAFNWIVSIRVIVNLHQIPDIP